MLASNERHSDATVESVTPSTFNTSNSFSEFKSLYRSINRLFKRSGAAKIIA